MMWIKAAGLLLIAIGTSIYCYARFCVPDQVIFSSSFATHDPVQTTVIIPGRGNFSLFVKFEGRPEEIGLTGEKRWFKERIGYPLRVKFSEGDKVLVETNRETLTLASYGATVACYRVASVSVEKQTKIELHVSADISGNLPELPPARIELHRSALAAQNVALFSRIAKLSGLTLLVIGVLLFGYSLVFKPKTASASECHSS